MRSYVATAIVLAMIAPAHAGGDEDTWSAPKKAVMHHQPVRVVMPSMLVELPAPGEVVVSSFLDITPAEAAVLCADGQVFAGNPDWYHRHCYAPSFSGSAENQTQDNSSPN